MRVGERGVRLQYSTIKKNAAFILEEGGWPGEQRAGYCVCHNTTFIFMRFSINTGVHHGTCH